MKWQINNIVIYRDSFFKYHKTMAPVREHCIIIMLFWTITTHFFGFSLAYYIIYI